MTKSLTFTTATALAACVVANAALLVAQVRQYGTEYGTEAANRATMWTGNLTGIRSGLLVLTAWVFLLWLRRARTVAEALSPEGHRHRFGWVVGAWLIPVVQYFLPKRIINDVWAASCPADRVRRTSVLLTSWWLFLVVAVTYTGWGWNHSRNARGAAETRAALQDAMIGAGLYLVTGVLAVAVVLELSRMQRDRLAEL
ncbi:MAG: hypothetical protein QOF44_4534 [Streptomyces sp.]|nr:hypothetical protein [Streptomyces sp.]